MLLSYATRRPHRNWGTGMALTVDATFQARCLQVDSSRPGMLRGVSILIVRTLLQPWPSFLLLKASQMFAYQEISSIRWLQLWADRRLFVWHAACCWPAAKQMQDNSSIATTIWGLDLAPTRPPKRFFATLWQRLRLQRRLSWAPIKMPPSPANCQLATG